MKKNSGQFKVGNAGGPGRPRRAVELDYLAVLSDVVPVETWRDVCERAAKDAANGDDKARSWLAKYLVGESSSLFELAKLESLGIAVGDWLAVHADAEMASRGDKDLLELVGESLYSRACSLAATSEEE